MKKIGFDIHGVIDYDPDFFSELSKKLIAEGNEVHIITGAPESEDVIQKLSDMNIEYTDFFSIVDWADSIGVPVEWFDSGPKMDEHLWDTAKSIYCSMNGIDLHIDDTPRYGTFFEHISTRFLLFEQSTMNMTMKVRQAIASVGECGNYPCNEICPQFILYKDNVLKSIEAVASKACSNELYDLADEIVEEIFDNLV